MTNLIYPLASTTWDEKEIESMYRVINSRNFTMGGEVFDFEKRFAEFFNSKFAVMSNSGSSANLLAIAAMKYANRLDKSKNEIIVPAVSWSTTFYPISQLGYKIRFVDVDLETLNISVDQVLANVNKSTAAIFAVNLLGNPAELIKLRQIADDLGIFLIEDNCESMGARVQGKYSGTFGEIGTFSCFYSHHISTMEGGVCLTDDEELAQIMISLRAHGWTRELPDKNFVFNKTGDAFDDLFRFVLPGYNLRPLELSGAIGKEQLLKLPKFIEERRKNSKLFAELIKSNPNVIIQKEYGESSWFGFSIILANELSGKRKQIVQQLDENGIDCRPIVAGNFAKNPVVKHLNHCELTPLPNAEKIHIDGLFVGNHHFDLSIGIEKLSKLLAQ